MKKLSLTKVDIQDGLESEIETFEYENGTKGWSYISDIYSIGGYGSKLEEIMNTITVEALEWMRSQSIDSKQIMKLAKWLQYNVFSIIGV